MAIKALIIGVQTLNNNYMPNEYDRYIKSTEEELGALQIPQKQITPATVPTGLIDRGGTTYTVDLATGNLVPLGAEFREDINRRRIGEESAQRQGLYGQQIQRQLGADIEEEKRRLTSAISAQTGGRAIESLGFSSAELGVLSAISDASQRRIKDLERSAQQALSKFNLEEYSRAKAEISDERKATREREATLFSRLISLKEAKTAEDTQIISDLVSANINKIPADETGQEKFYSDLATVNNLDVNSVKSAFQSAIAKSKATSVSTDIDINNLLKSIPKTETINIGGQSYSGLKEEDVNTQVVEANGQKKLINSQTGETIKVLGYSASAIAASGGDVITNPDGTEQQVQYIDSKTGKIAKMPMTQAEAIASFNSSISAIEKARELFMDENGNFKIKTGPIQYRIYTGAKLIDKAKTEEIQFDALLSQVKANFMKAISGAAVSESEVKRLSKFLPEMTDQESVLAIKLGTLANELRNHKISLLNASGIKEVGGETVSYSLEDLANQKGYSPEKLKKAKESGYSDEEIKSYLEGL